MAKELSPEQLKVEKALLSIEHVAVMLEGAIRVKDDNPALELMKADFTGLMEAVELLKRMARGRSEMSPVTLLKSLKRCLSVEDRECVKCELHDDSYCVDTLLSALADMTGMTDEEKALAVWPDEE